MSKPDPAQTLNIRIGTEERKLIERMAKVTGKNVDDFIQDSLTSAAADVLLGQNLVITKPTKYTEFLERLDRPQQPTSACAKPCRLPCFGGEKDAS
jgi:uncharacterized protein (DUF1778 family)